MWTGRAWYDYVKQSEAYWDDIVVEMSYGPTPDPENVPILSVLHDGPSKGYGSVWKELNSLMKGALGEGHLLVQHMLDVRADGDHTKLHDCLMFWATIDGKHTHTMKPDASYKHTVDIMAAGNGDLDHAQATMHKEMETFNTYISMEVAHCTELQWALVIASSPCDVAPNYVSKLTLTKLTIWKCWIQSFGTIWQYQAKCHLV